ncbi:amino acid adenylation domain-containing protein [Streptomyces sp. NPDC051218]|uniref:amino acid adenylation domain-containing protein n=1 Tax=Streptomyces sp. NPDC051218 TaxID=3365645 RepID=UPI0037B6DB38
MSATVVDAYPLGPAQHGILFHTLLEQAVDDYLVQHYCVLDEVDTEVLREAWQRVVGRHQALRTSFAWQGLEEPVQVVASAVSTDWRELDWRDLSTAEQAAARDRLLDDDRHRPLDIYTAPLMRICVVRLTDTSVFLLWTFHHLILDGWSAALVLRQVDEEYVAAGAGTPAPPHRGPTQRDYVLWQRQQDLAAADGFWSEYLNGFTRPTSLGIDRLSDRAEGLGQRRAEVSGPVSAALKDFARTHGLTLNAVVQGAWALLMSWYSGERDVVFGATTSGRPTELKGAAQMVGMFINTLPARITVSEDLTLRDWLCSVQQRQAEAREFESTPLVRVREASGVPGGTELFDTVLVFENYPGADTAVGGPRRRDVGYRERTNYLLTVDVHVGDCLAFEAFYDRARLDDTSVDLLLKHVTDLIEQFVADPDRSAAAYAPRYDPPAWHVTTQEPPDTGVDRCLHELIAEQASRTPNRVAVEHGASHYTYRQLDEAAEAVADRLVREGVRVDMPVAVLIERSLDLMVGLLAVLKAGGAYLPLDVETPTAWTTELLARAGCAHVVTSRSLADRVPSDCRVIAVDEAPTAGTSGPSGCVRPVLRPDNLVSVFFTSGSTGVPKIVANTHRGWVGRLRWMQQRYQLAEGEGVLHKTTLTFDDSAVELFWPLMTGGRVVMLDPGLHRDPTEITRAVVAHQVAVLHFVPSMLALWLDACDVPDLSLAALRVVVSSGEALGDRLVERSLRRLAPIGCQLVNQWGVTEASIDSTAHACGQDSGDLAPVPIGLPISGHRVYILDPQLRPLPPGVAGGLYLGGAGLARGYLHDARRTAQAFLPDPFIAGQRMYRTGDQGYRRADGTLVFLGRHDNQVKIRGIRAEIEDIEARLAEDSAIREVAAEVREFGPDDQRLVAFVSGVAEEDVPQLRERLAARLPVHMVPSLFVTRDRLPRLVNDKVDRRALGEIDVAPPAMEDDPQLPRNHVEKTVLDIWREVLKLDRIGITDDFFMLGGHSLLVPQLISRVGAAFETAVPLSLLFANPTVARMAVAVEDEVRREIEAMSEEEINDHAAR